MGINGYYVQEMERKMLQPPKTSKADIAYNNKSIKHLALSNTSLAKSENTVWNQIRQGLREELGDHIDQACGFLKL